VQCFAKLQRILKRRLYELKENSERREQMGKASRKRAEELDWKNIAPKFEEVYEGVLKNGR